jgi:hypothetical protein
MARGKRPAYVELDENFQPGSCSRLHRRLDRSHGPRPLPLRHLGGAFESPPVRELFLSRSQNPKVSIAALPMSAVVLFPELIDRLYDNKPFLCSCCLMCTAWLHSSRYYLFSELVFIPQNIGSFAQLLKSPSPSQLASVVRHVVLEGLIPLGYDSDDELDGIALI